MTVRFDRQLLPPAAWFAVALAASMLAAVIIERAVFASRASVAPSAMIFTTGYVEAVADMKDGELGLLMKPYTLEGLAEALRVAVP